MDCAGVTTAASVLEWHAKGSENQDWFVGAAVGALLCLRLPGAFRTLAHGNNVMRCMPFVTPAVR